MKITFYRDTVTFVFKIKISQIYLHETFSNLIYSKVFFFSFRYLLYLIRRFVLRHLVYIYIYIIESTFLFTKFYIKFPENLFQSTLELQPVISHKILFLVDVYNTYFIDIHFCDEVIRDKSAGII